ncbi:NrfD/PsrC family molybdoenzyme membrane anchor subunit [Thiothrix winogradskyi]|uniref:Polysulfide reductase NrfD n=1 Tax=Thiothrix winogradskyi TaxID=96472 RepID=A0ABY3T737_9GAMM|nr:NrfD/PsrC family molybdoenzyme membrane anchor subunit [Thiothrix winogradskyi]UJS26321.1 polysulfide reductase NrfD [Thiothrix winogradskyi]
MGDYNVFHHIPWTGAYAIYFFTIGISAALFFFSARSWFASCSILEPIRKPAAYVSFVLLVISGLLLISDLSQPMRFLNTMNPFYMNFNSPLAWGGLNLMSFGIVSALYVFMMWKGNDALAKKLGVVGAVLALGLPIYTGFDLTVHQNRPVWNTPLMPVLFVAMSLVSGAAVAIFLALNNASVTKHLRTYMFWSAAAVAVMLIALMGTTAYGGVGAELTFMSLTSGSLSFAFLWVGVILGTIIPIALLLTPVGTNHVGTLAAAALILVGGFALRYSILIGGQVVQSYF